jgi:hypothetical protein
MVSNPTRGVGVRLSVYIPYVCLHVWVDALLLRLTDSPSKRSHQMSTNRNLNTEKL